MRDRAFPGPTACLLSPDLPCTLVLSPSEISPREEKEEHLMGVGCTDLPQY